jgi:3-deoxy-manno-octulosonate cytidylyltransferase (CMP-KDO synthetase)
VRHTANKSNKNIIAIIPARLASIRLPNKLLLPLAGKPLILRTVEQAKKARDVSRVIVATDSQEILRIVRESGNEAVLTSEKHQSGSDRIAEVAERLSKNSIIVNVQGDEPLISPSTIEKAINAILQDDSIDMATTCEPIYDAKDILNFDIVKVVSDVNDFALYFSRSPIPFPRESVRKYGTFENALFQENNLLSLYRKHTGLYVYRREFLLKYTKLEQTNLEKTEMLEQLRALESGARIKVVEVSESSIGVDTREDFERVRKILEGENKNKINYREATIEDIPQIAVVHVRSWQKSFAGIAPQEYLDKMSVENRIEKFEKAFSQNSFYKMFVAETSAKGIVGFADFGKAPGENSSEADLYAIYFLQEFQRKGIGGNLFRRCQKEMSANGFNSMSLDALEKSPYRKFYEKMGGRVVGAGKHKLGEIEFKTVIYRWDDLQKYE